MPQNRPVNPGAPLFTERFVSYAPNLEDVLLWRALGRQLGADGFYIDVGATAPDEPSVTRAFYERGWRGLNVATAPEAAARIREARPRDVVLGTPEPPILARLCEAHVAGPIHFMRIAVENAAAVLAGADFARDRPWLLLVRTDPADAAPAWEPALLAARYEFVWCDGLSRFYLAHEQSALAAHFRLPPNVRDNYTVFDPRLHEELAEAAALSRRQAGALRALEAQLAELRGHSAAVPAAAALAAPSSLPVAPAPIPIAPARKMSRRIGKRLYWLVRPVARPLAWRGRQFLIGEIRAELAGLRERLDQLVARPVTGPGGESTALTAAMERVLLTLAVLDAQDPAPPGLAPPSLAPEPAASSLSNDEPGR